MPPSLFLNLSLFELDAAIELVADGSTRHGIELSLVHRCGAMDTELSIGDGQSLSLELSLGHGHRHRAKLPLFFLFELGVSYASALEAKPPDLEAHL